MTQEEKAKAYDEALEKAKQALKTDLHESGAWAIKSIFPELAESEDERIRELIIETVFRYYGNSQEYTEVLAWLEKRKEQIPYIDSLQDKRREVIINGHKLVMKDGALTFVEAPEEEAAAKYIRTIKGIIADFVRDKQPKDVAFYQKIYDWLDGRHIEQKPAECIEDSVKFEEGFKAGRETGLRDGQKYVLNNLDSYGLCKPAEWSEEEKGILLECISALQNSSHWLLADKLSSLRPQPKQEWSEDFEDNIRNLLHDKLTGHSEDGRMSWATLIDDKTLKDIVNGIWFYVGKEALKYPNKELSQPEWNEDDKKILDELLDHCNTENATWYNFLKSLRPQPKQEWSEEDEENFKWFDKLFRAESVIVGGRDIPQDKYLWFKSLRPSWKPTETEITALENLMKGEFPNKLYPGTTLSELLVELKKLYYNESIPSWKPSEEQMEALNALNCHGDLSYIGQQSQLISLYNDLKKL